MAPGHDKRGTAGRCQLALIRWDVQTSADPCDVNDPQNERRTADDTELTLAGLRVAGHAHQYSQAFSPEVADRVEIDNESRAVGASAQTSL